MLVTRWCIILWLFWRLVIIFPTSSFAIEVAPRISDREIIESLTELKAGQKSLERHMTGMENRITGMENRITGMENRMTSIENRMEEQFRFLMGTMITLILAVVGGGFIMWRKLYELDADVKMIKKAEEDRGFLQAQVLKLEEQVQKLIQQLKIPPGVL